MTNWDWKHYDQLSKDDLFELLLLRQQVFIIEQQCVYPDIDEMDKVASHLIGWDRDEKGHQNISAYLRVMGLNKDMGTVSIGRVLTNQNSRGQGLAKRIMKKAIELINTEYPDEPIKLAAQSYLVNFYAGLGFNPISKEYFEDGIAHVDMLKD